MRVLSGRSRSAVSSFVLLVLFLLASAATVGAQTWLYAAGGDEYAVIDPVSGDIVHRGPLAADGISPTATSPVEIIPTPGGRYVFFLVPEASAAIVVDAETHLPVRSVSLPAGVDGLQFSSMGDAVYLQVGDERVSVDHQRGDLSGSPVPAPSLEPGRIAFNRRATRLFGQRGRDLVYALAQNGESVTEVNVGPEAHDWIISPNFRFLLGVAQSGDGLVLVDEQRGRVSGRIREQVEPDSIGFDDASRTFHALASEGSASSIIVADVRRARIQDQIDLDQRATRLFRDSDGAFHVLYDDGSVGIRAGSPNEDLLSIGFASTVTDLALVVLKPGQGFACF